MNIKDDMIVMVLNIYRAFKLKPQNGLLTFNLKMYLNLFR